MKGKLETETETEMKTKNGNKKMHQSWVKCLHRLMSSALCHYSCILLSCITGFMSHVLCLYSCTVLWLMCIWQAMLQSSLVHM